MSYSLIAKELRKRYFRNADTMVVILGDWPIIKNQIVGMYQGATALKTDREKVIFISDILEPAIRRYEKVTFGVKGNPGWDDSYRLAALTDQMLTGMVSNHEKLILDHDIDISDTKALRKNIYEHYVHKTIKKILRKADYDEAVLDDCLAINA